ASACPRPRRASSDRRKSVRCRRYEPLPGGSTSDPALAWRRTARPSCPEARPEAAPALSDTPRSFAQCSFVSVPFRDSTPKSLFPMGPATLGWHSSTPLDDETAGQVRRRSTAIALRPMPVYILNFLGVRRYRSD